ncbi:Flp pilus assembly complex ATPase component TadA [bacterium]|nr:Flp pilus assembly complex ATPase component TadA [bacterium]
MLDQIPEILRAKGFLTEEQSQAIRDKAVQDPDKRIDRILLESGLVSEENYLQAMAEEMGFGFTDLSDRQPDEEAIRLTPTKFVFKNKVFPLAVEGNGTLVVATSEPFEILSLDELETLTGHSVEPIFAPEKEITKQIKSYFGVGGETLGDMVGGDSPDGNVDLNPDDDEAMAESASVIRLVNEILTEAVRERTSDIHIEPGEDGLQIRYRVDGVLQLQALPPEIFRFQSAIASRIKIMSKLNIAEKRKPQDGRIKMRVDGRDIDLRVSIIPMLYGEGIVLRVLDKGKMVYDLRKIGMDQDIYDDFAKLIALPHGILLVTGPTGSGKSTTLYSALNEIKGEDTKIITVEDPVEYQMAGISQIQVNHKVGLDFSAGLRAILRHDPDVVLVGEIRDFETGQIAIQAAMTGHLVFSTLHTNDAPSAFSRLVDMGIEPYLVASTVVGVMAQRLVRRICSNCKAEVAVHPMDLPSDFPQPDVGFLWKGSGCEKCRSTGYSGRVGIYELLRPTPAIQPLILNRATSSEIKIQAIADGMQTLRTYAWKRVLEGVTTVEEVMRVSKEDEVAAPSKPSATPAASSAADD